MQNYEKPEVILMTECLEGVYLASGGQTGEDPTAGGCDSRYMKGAWKAGLQQQQCADACL